MSFSENSHAALDLQVGGSNKKQKRNTNKTNTNKKTGTQQKQSGNNKAHEIVNKISDK